MKALSINRLCRTITANLLALTALPACSLAFVSKPDPENDEVQPCTESYTAPIVDTVLAALSGIGGVIAVANGARNSFGGPDGAEAGAMALGAGIGLGISAIYGYDKVEACREHNRNARKSWQRIEVVE